MNAAPSDARVHRMCQYLLDVRGIERSEDLRCKQCPRHVHTPYGKGYQGCYGIALEALEVAERLDGET